jgi:Kef-type K+ transport system membrane component KefB
VTFGTLALIVLAGLAGPMLARVPGLSAPIVVGEIAAGVLIGKTGFGWVNTADPTLQFLSSIGFALLMLVVGTHLPLREPGLRAALGRGATATVLSFLIAVPCAWALARAAGVNHPGMIVLLLATSSAAVAMPIIRDAGLVGRTALVATAWIALADIATIIGLPIVFAAGQVARVITGGVIVTACAVATFFALRFLHGVPVVHALRRDSKHRGWAVDLRISLLVLFVLAWIAERFSVSVLVAGFSAGAILAFLGEPRRVAWQLIGVGEGFFIPLFFVSLGARLQFRGLFDQPRNLVLLGLLVIAIGAVHVVVAVTIRVPVAIGLLASAQLGVPAAVASLALQRNYLQPGAAAAVITAAVLSLGMSAVGAARLRPGARGGDPSTAPPDTAAIAQPDAPGQPA